jgi:hypothetical protein
VSTDAQPLCRHCGLRKANRPRPLCWHDFYAPGVRDQYEPFCRCGHAARGPTRGNVLPPAPTSALSGSPEKVAVLEERARLRVRLWHPLDASA